MAEERILIVEDEPRISEIVQSYLERDGFAVTAVEKGNDALLEMKNHYDLVILDLRLPDMAGEDVCRAIRQVSNLPIIMLTAKSGEDDRVKGLGIGADDYVVKPFSPREVVARVKAHLRRMKGPERSILSFNKGALSIDARKMEVRSAGKPVTLTATEFKILLSLAEAPEVVMSRLQLINAAQGFDFEGFDRVIDAHIKNIRHKIEKNPQKPSFIKTVYGMGYKFIGEPDK